MADEPITDHPVTIASTAEAGASQPINVAVNPEARQQRSRDYIMATLLGIAMLGHGAIGLLTVFHIPQDGNLVLSVKNDLKEFILMMLSGYFTAKVMGTK
jgi:hypothetical protein